MTLFIKNFTEEISVADIKSVPDILVTGEIVPGGNTSYESLFYMLTPIHIDFIDYIYITDNALSVPWLAAGIMPIDLYPGGAVATIYLYNMVLTTAPITVIRNSPIFGDVQDEDIIASMLN